MDVEENLEHILLHLSVSEIPKFCRANTRYRQFCDSPHYSILWRAILGGDFFLRTVDNSEIKRVLPKRKIVSLNQFLEIYRELFTKAVLFQDSRLRYLPHLRCIVAISPFGKLDEPFFDNYPAVNQSFDDPPNLFEYKFQKISGLLELIPMHPRQTEPTDKIITHSETLVVRIILVSYTLITVDEETVTSLIPFYDISVEIEFTKKLIQDAPYDTTNAHRVIFSNGLVCTFQKDRADYEPTEKTNFVPAYGVFEVYDFQILNVPIDSSQIEFRDFFLDQSERVRRFSKSTDTLTSSIKTEIDPTKIARVLPENQVILSYDSRNLKCTICNNPEHTIPLDYLNWWIQEGRSITDNACPRCNSRVMQ